MLGLRTIPDLVEAMRPRQWLKNGFVLAPLVFAGRFSDGPSIGLALAAVASFCLAASSVYLINDLNDVEEDRHHPSKKLRPLASGRLSASFYLVAALVLLASSLAISSVLGLRFTAVLGSYLALTSAYTFSLKRIVILDVIVLALGFVLRVVGGAVALDVRVSHWLILCTFLLALFLALGKRRGELLRLGENAGDHRQVLARYSVPWIDQAVSGIFGATLVCYCLYTVAPDTVERLGSSNLIVTVPYVLFGMLRYLLLLHQADEKDGDPTGTLISDLPLQICVVLWLATASVVFLIS